MKRIILELYHARSNVSHTYAQRSQIPARYLWNSHACRRYNIWLTRGARNLTKIIRLAYCGNVRIMTNVVASITLVTLGILRPGNVGMRVNIRKTTACIFTSILPSSFTL